MNNNLERAYDIYWRSTLRKMAGIITGDPFVEFIKASITVSCFKELE
jgi:hypothetical protein